CDARADVDGQLADLPVDQLAFSRVDPGSNLYARRAYAVDDRLGTADGPCWAVERREEAVTGRVRLLPPKAFEQGADRGVVPFAIAPRKSAIVYAGSLSGAVFRGTNGRDGSDIGEPGDGV